MVREESASARKTAVQPSVPILSRILTEALLEKAVDTVPLNCFIRPDSVIT
jgi:hypothetical protein